MTSRGIYSVYLAKAEEEKLRELAQRNGTSVNFVVRVAVRKLLGMPTPDVDVAKLANSSN